MNIRASFRTAMIATLMAALLVPLFAFASTFKANDNVSITNQDDVTSNVYVAGGTVSVNAPLGGDLLASGGNIIITESIAKDIAVAGGSITILGDVGDDVRAAGGTIVITGNIAGELIAAGGSVTIANDVTIGKDVVIASGQVTLNGTIEGDVRVIGGVATINGTVRGNVLAELEESITLGSDAVVQGNILYKARQAEALHMDDGATVAGEVVFEELRRPEAPDVGNMVAATVGVFLLFKLLSTIVVVLILVRLFRNFSETIVRSAIQEPLRMLGYGFMTLIVVPVAAILLLVSLLGIPLAIASLLAYGLLVLLACLYAGVVLGSWVGTLIGNKTTVSINWKTVIGGIVLLSLVNLIPIVGWLVGFLIFLITLGSLANLAHKKFWQSR